MNSKGRFIVLAIAVSLGGVCDSFAQSITDFSPKFGSVGELVRIDGSGFTGVTNVIFFNGKSVRVTPTADTQINAMVPTGATTGAITVVKGANHATSFEDFTVIGPEPYVTSFSPISGAGGTVVTLNGAHFTGVTSVQFNGTNGNIVQLTSDTQIRVSPAVGVSTGPIKLTRSGGTFTTSSNFFAPASITSFSPSNGRPGTNVVIKGKNFLGTTVLKVNQVVIPSFSVDSNTEITMTLPTNATTGLININPPGGQASSTSNFVVFPSFYSFSPPFGSTGTNVTIIGANLLGNTKVKFNGGPDVTPPSATLTATQMVVTVPAGTTSGLITVTTTNGTATSATLFYIPPTISGYSPVTGSAGTLITVTGLNFTNATDVRFNGAAATFTVVNNSTITATIPPDATSGPISITTPGGTVTDAQNFFIQPVVSGFNPGFGLAGTVVTVTGSNLTNATAVRFNGVNASFTAGNNFQLTATVPTNATTGPISVVAPGGTGVSAANFVVEALALTIKLLTNNAASISWTASATGFNLESSTNLSSTNWVLVTNIPTVSNGQNTVTNQTTNSARYYRLKK